MEIESGSATITGLGAFVIFNYEDLGVASSLYVPAGCGVIGTSNIHQLSTVYVFA